MPLHGAAALEFCDEQLLGAQKEPNIGAAITKRAPTAQIILRHEIRL